MWKVQPTRTNCALSRLEAENKKTTMTLCPRVMVEAEEMNNGSLRAANGAMRKRHIEHPESAHTSRSKTCCSFTQYDIIVGEQSSTTVRRTPILKSRRARAWISMQIFKSNERECGREILKRHAW